MDDLIRRIKAGDAASAAVLINRHELRIRMYAAKVAPRPDMAEDVAQKAFLMALKSIESFDPTRDFALWMQGIVRNVARQEWERLALRSRVERDGLAGYLEELAARPEPESEIDERWLKALRGCVQKLPDRSREIVNLHYSMGMSCRHVAERIGTSVHAVKMAMVRIRGALRGCVQGKLAEV
jgi:RNA polymerase sigma-70 factor (ECF subfamily)